jgi:hypothetical protein
MTCELRLYLSSTLDCLLFLRLRLRLLLIADVHRELLQDWLLAVWRFWRFLLRQRLIILNSLNYLLLNLLKHPSQMLLLV